MRISRRAMLGFVTSSALLAIIPDLVFEGRKDDIEMDDSLAYRDKLRNLALRQESGYGRGTYRAWVDFKTNQPIFSSSGYQA